METNRVSEGKSHEQQRASTNASRGKPFDERPAGPQGQNGHAQNEQEKSVLHYRQHAEEPANFAVKRQTAGKLVRRGDRCQPLHIHQDKCTGGGPEAIGAMADGIAEREVFEEGKQNDESDGQREDSR